MKRYSTLHPLVMAFYSPKIYRDVAYAWRGACILYLLILVALAQVPRMRFSGGTLAAEEPGVHRVVDPKSGRLLALFDTTGASRTPEETPALALFTATEVSIRTGERETETFPYSKNLAFTVTRERLTRFLDLYASYAAAALYPVAVALAMAFRVAQALLAVGEARLDVVPTRCRQGLHQPQQGMGLGRGHRHVARGADLLLRREPAGRAAALRRDAR